MVGPVENDVIMFLLAGTTALGVVMAVFGGVLLITDNRDRLRLDRLHTIRQKT